MMSDMGTPPPAEPMGTGGMGQGGNRQRNIYIIVAVVVALLLCCCCLFLVLAYIYGDQVVDFFSAIPNLTRLLL